MTRIEAIDEIIKDEMKNGNARMVPALKESLRRMGDLDIFAWVFQIQEANKAVKLEVLS